MKVLEKILHLKQIKTEEAMRWGVDNLVRKAVFFGGGSMTVPLDNFYQI